MKKLFPLIFSLLALAACTSEYEQMLNDATRAGKLGEDSFYATIETAGEGDSQTKVYADDQMCVLWNAGDMISIFNKKTDNLKYQFAGEDGDNAGAFTKVSWEAATGSDLSYVYAIYPYKEATSISGDGIISFQLPSAQQYRAHSFGTGANTMVSVSEGNRLLFKNAGGYLSLKLYGSDVKVKSISLRGNNKEKLAGAALISMPYGSTPTVTMQESATEYVTLTCETPVTLGATAEEYTEFWFVLPPTNFTKGFTVTVTDDGGCVFEKSTNKTLSIARNTLSRMAQVEVVPKQTMVPPDNEIWYITEDGKVSNDFNTLNYGCTMLTNTYSDGKGIVKCDKPIKQISLNGFFSTEERMDITNIYLPETVEMIGQDAFSWYGITEFRVPRDLKTVGSWAFNDVCLTTFIGNNVSQDGHLLIIDGIVVATALYGIEKYSFPGGIIGIGDFACSYNRSLKEIHFPEGLKYIGQDAFSFCTALSCEIYLPNSLESVGYRAFGDSFGISGYYGNPQFSTSDHHCLLDNNQIVSFAGKDVETYEIPEGIVGIKNTGLAGAVKLKRLVFPESMEAIGGGAFSADNYNYRCNLLEEFSGFHVTSDGKGFIRDGVLYTVVPKCPETYIIPNGVKHIGDGCFLEHFDIKSIICDDEIEYIGSYAFGWCTNLREIVLPKNLKSFTLYEPFAGCRSLEKIYFRSFFPPSYSDTQTGDEFHDGLAIYVPEETYTLYKRAPQWSQYSPYMIGYKYDDIGEWAPDYYYSSDYSHDGETTVLQHSTTGNGIDLILMGDAFSDRQIANGTYENVMLKAVDAFFSEAPYDSFKNFFNISYVNVVSWTEGYEHIGQTLGTEFGVGTYVDGNNQMVIEYARKAVPDERMDDALIIVLMNQDYYAGTCFMYYPDSGDYGRGLSIAYFPTCSDLDTFNGLVSHEAGGHGFAKLADEYANEYMGAVTQDDLDVAHLRENWGWNKNIDFTCDPNQIKWSQFISDIRYAAENIGCYEGAYTYETGVWRPTENSIMRYNTGGFNAPSRYAIWYRIGKLAYGEDWNGSYEDFVSFDAINRTSSAGVQQETMGRNYVERRLPPLAPPVVVGHSWREELK